MEAGNIQEFKALATQLSDWMRVNTNPHSVAIVEPDAARLMYGEASFQVGITAPMTADAEAVVSSLVQSLRDAHKVDLDCKTVEVSADDLIKALGIMARY